VLQNLQPYTAVLNTSVPLTLPQSRLQLGLLWVEVLCLPQNITHVFTQCLALVSSLTEMKFPSFSSLTEFPQLLSLGLYSSQDFDISTKNLHLPLPVTSSSCIPCYSSPFCIHTTPVQPYYSPLIKASPKVSAGWSFAHSYFKQSKQEMNTEKWE